MTEFVTQCNVAKCLCKSKLKAESYNIASQVDVFRVARFSFVGRDKKRTPLKKPALEASYNTTHNFFVLEDGRSNSLLQTYKLVVLKEI